MRPMQPLVDVQGPSIGRLTWVPPQGANAAADSIPDPALRQRREEFDGTLAAEFLTQLAKALLIVFKQKNSPRLRHMKNILDGTLAPLSDRLWRLLKE